MSSPFGTGLLDRLCVRVAMVHGRPRLQSSDDHQLLIPQTCTVTLGPCAFNTSGPASWNALPAALHDPAVTLGTFRQMLKSFEMLVIIIIIIWYCAFVLSAVRVTAYCGISRPWNCVRKLFLTCYFSTSQHSGPWPSELRDRTTRSCHWKVLFSPTTRVNKLVFIDRCHFSYSLTCVDADGDEA